MNKDHTKTAMKILALDILDLMFYIRLFIILNLKTYQKYYTHLMLVKRKTPVNRLINFFRTSISCNWINNKYVHLYSPTGKISSSRSHSGRLTEVDIQC